MGYELGISRKEYDYLRLSKNSKVAFVSNRFKLDNNHINFLFKKFKINQTNDDLKLIYIDEIYSAIELEYSTLVKGNGTNNYLYKMFVQIKCL